MFVGNTWTLVCLLSGSKLPQSIIKLTALGRSGRPYDQLRTEMQQQLQKQQQRRKDRREHRDGDGDGDGDADADEDQHRAGHGIGGALRRTQRSAIKKSLKARANTLVLRTVSGKAQNRLSCAAAKVVQCPLTADRGCRCSSCGACGAV
jgi:hypothetical protein